MSRPISVQPSTTSWAQASASLEMVGLESILGTVGYHALAELVGSRVLQRVHQMAVVAAWSPIRLRMV